MNSVATTDAARSWDQAVYPAVVDGDEWPINSWVSRRSPERRYTSVPNAWRNWWAEASTPQAWMWSRSSRDVAIDPGAQIRSLCVLHAHRQYNSARYLAIFQPICNQIVHMAY